MKYIALLRGINVGGHKIIPMAKLRAIFESAGFTNVSTYIQSGNVVFGSPAKDTGAVRVKVEKMLSESLGYEVPTLIRTGAEMTKVIAKNIFAEEHAKGKTKMYVVFLERKPGKKEADDLLSKQVKGMSFHINGCEAYCLLDAKFSGNDSPLNKIKLETILGQKATMRNWATVNTLLNLATE